MIHESINNVSIMKHSSYATSNLIIASWENFEVRVGFAVANFRDPKIYRVLLVIKSGLHVSIINSVLYMIRM